MDGYAKLLSYVSYIQSVTDFKPETGLVLGSGLGGYASEADIAAEVPYSDIPGFPVSTVPGHDGKFVFGYSGGVPVVMMKGRVHCYEGYDPQEAVAPVRVMGMLGIKNLILTNAADSPA